MSAVFVYVTCAGEDEAERVARHLLERRLVACANIIPGMRSLYWWKGALEEAREVVLVAKTRDSLVDRLTAEVRAVHGYEVPCVVALPILGGNPDFLRWIEDETEGAA